MARSNNIFVDLRLEMQGRQRRAKQDEERAKQDGWMVSKLRKWEGLDIQRVLMVKEMSDGFTENTFSDPERMK